MHDVKPPINEILPVSTTLRFRNISFNLTTLTRNFAAASHFFLLQQVFQQVKSSKTPSLPSCGLKEAALADCAWKPLWANKSDNKGVKLVLVLVVKRQAAPFFVFVLGLCAGDCKSTNTDLGHLSVNFSVRACVRAELAKYTDVFAPKEETGRDVTQLADGSQNKRVKCQAMALKKKKSFLRNLFFLMGNKCIVQKNRTWRGKNRTASKNSTAHKYFPPVFLTLDGKSEILKANTWSSTSSKGFSRIHKAF